MILVDSEGDVVECRIPGSLKEEALASRPALERDGTGSC
jgi:hypothetical protein